MPLDTASASPTQEKIVLKSAGIFISPPFIDYRELLPRGSVHIRVGLSQSLKRKLGVDRVQFEYADGAPPFEINSRVKLAGKTEIKTEDWGRGRKGKILVVISPPEYAPFEPDPAPRIEGLPRATCRSLEKHFGCDFIAAIAANPDLLKKTKFSIPKSKIIAEACAIEQKTRQGETGKTKALVSALCQSGVKIGKARDLAERFNPESGPYQFLFSRNMTLLQADRFAAILDPVRAKLESYNNSSSASRHHPERPLALVADNFLRVESTLLSRDEIVDASWRDYELKTPTAQKALDGLILHGVVREFKFETPSALFGHEPEGFEAPPIIEIFYGLKSLIDAEELIAQCVTDNPRLPPLERLSLPSASRRSALLETASSSPRLEPDAETCKIIQYVIDHAAEFLGRPGFVLAEKQIEAIWNTFRYKFSVLTGPPGTGKTAICALINVIAALLYPDIDPPARGLALAGRAASVLREACVCWHEGRVFAMEASTIHSALAIRAESNDDDCRLKAKIRTGVLILDEASMISSSFFAAILRSCDAEHFLIVGDPAQLPPIGCGKPFHDLVAFGAAPITRLEHNYRTDCPGIRMLCDLVRDGDETKLRLGLANCLTAGGVHHAECDGAASKARSAAEYFAHAVIENNHAATDIAILTPQKQSNAGTVTINLNVRLALGMPALRLVEGDMLIATQNNYKAPRQNGKGVETIYTGERCHIARRGDDFLDIDFPKDARNRTRQIRLLMRDPDAGTIDGQLPEGFALGYAMTVHKAQGSQFWIVIAVTARAYRNVGIVQRSNGYTAISRAQKALIILGDMDEFIGAATMDEIPRRTLLEKVFGTKGLDRSDIETPRTTSARSKATGQSPEIMF